jgi:hypothetical protein
VEDGEVAGGGLVVARGHSPAALEVVEEALDSVAESVKAAIEARPLLATGVRMNDGFDAEDVRALPDVVGVVAGVGDYRLAFDVEEEFLGDGGFVLLPRRELQVDWLTARRCDGVNFR